MTAPGSPLVITALELLASTIAFMVFAPPAVDGERARFGTRVTSWTDSQVASAASHKGMSTTYPLCLVQMELAAQLEACRAVLTPDWAPRDMNVEADDLTNEDFSKFTPGLRIHVDMDTLPWLVFPSLVREAREFYAGVVADPARPQGPARVWPGARPRARGKRLRDTDPW